MSANPLCILICSGEHEKIHMAAMMGSVAAVTDRPVTIFISMNAVYAFRKDAPTQERYRGGAFSEMMLEKKAPDTLELLSQGKMLGEMSLHVCSMAMDVLEWSMDDLVDDLFDSEMGLTKFLAEAEAGELITI